MSKVKFWVCMAMCLLVASVAMATAALNPHRGEHVEAKEAAKPTSFRATSYTPVASTVATTSTTRPQPPPTTTTSQPRPRPAATRATPSVAGGDMETWITELGNCESGYNLTDQEGFYEGAFQFAPSTWQSMGTEYAHAYQAPESVQRDAVKRLVARNGGSFRGQFPACSRKLGLP